KRLSAGGRRDDRDIAPGCGVRESLGLMSVETIDAARDQGFAQCGRKSLRKVGEFTRTGGLALNRADGRIGIGHPFLEVFDGAGEPGLSGHDPLLGWFRETKAEVHVFALSSLE